MKRRVAKQNTEWERGGVGGEGSSCWFTHRIATRAVAVPGISQGAEAQARGQAASAFKAQQQRAGERGKKLGLKPQPVADSSQRCRQVA